MHVDQPAHNTAVDQSFTISGCALDAAWAGASGTGVSNVTIWAYPNPGSGQAPEWWGDATLGGYRLDVQQAFSLPSNFRPSGFSTSISGKASGVYYVIVYAFSTVTNSYSQAQAFTVYVDMPTATLTIDRPGAGTGAVGGIGGGGGGAGTAQFACGDTLPRGSVVTLTATPDAGSVFSGWGGACSGTSSCTVTVNAATLVIARFDPNPGLETSSYHLDALGSVRAVTNEAAVELARHDYFAFGEDSAPMTGDR